LNELSITPIIVPDGPIHSVVPGKKIAGGESSELYEMDGDKMLKLHFPQIPGHHFIGEFNVSKLINKVGIPSTKYLYLAEWQGRKGFVYEKLHGEDLQIYLERAPWKIFSIGKMLGRAHLALHAHTAPEELSENNFLLLSRIKRKANLLMHRFQMVEALMKDLPFGDQVVHADFHLKNVIRKTTGELIPIDWSNCTKGHFMGDVAETYLKFRFPKLSPNLSFAKRIISKLFAKIILRNYLKEYRRHRPISEQELWLWLLAVAASNVGDYPEFTERYLLFIDALLAKLKKS